MNISVNNYYSNNRKYMITPMKSNNTVFQGNKKAVENGFKIGAALAASALFAESIKEIGDPSKIIKEFYESENTHNKLGVRLDRFTLEEQYEIMKNADEISLFPNAFKRVISAKKDDGSYRFNMEDSFMIFDEVAPEIEKSPVIFKKIVSEKDENNKERFDVTDCIILMRNLNNIKMCPKAFNLILSVKGLTAKECTKLINSCSIILENNPEYFDKAMQSIDSKENLAKNLATNIISINRKVIQEKRNAEKLKQQEAEELQQKIKEEARKMRQMHELERKAKAEKQAKIRAKKEALRAIERQKQSEIRAKQREEEKVIELARIEDLNKEVGWIPQDKLIEKVSAAVKNNTQLILENGEVIPDEVRDNVLKNIKEHPYKVNRIINARYSNKRPMFSEKTCYEIIGDLYLYKKLDQMQALRRVNVDGTPYFNAEQCKELLKINMHRKDSSIFKTNIGKRKLSPEDNIEIVKNRDVVCYRYMFSDLAKEIDENGDYKYTIKECLDMSRKIGPVKPQNIPIFWGQI